MISNSILKVWEGQGTWVDFGKLKIVWDILPEEKKTIFSQILGKNAKKVDFTESFFALNF